MKNKTIEKLLQDFRAFPLQDEFTTKEFDRFTIQDLGISESLLIENAARGVSNLICSLSYHQNPNDIHIIFFVGPGNNGADTIACARHLVARNYVVEVVMVVPDKKSNGLASQIDLFSQLITHLPNSSAHVFVHDHLRDLAQSIPRAQRVFIIDGIFGAGLSRAPQGTANDAISWINQFRQNNAQNCQVISVDVPSGISVEARSPLGSCVSADHTCTFHALKRCHVSEPTKQFCGNVHVTDIGLFENHPHKNFWIPRQTVLHSLLQKRNGFCHKGDFGHVLIYEGNPKMLGASRLSAHAALRAGAGLVSIATNNNQPTPFDIPEFMRCECTTITPEFLKKIDALVIGPGLSQERKHKDQALDFLHTHGKLIPFIVVDADALTFLKDKKFSLPHTSIIATPHPKEAAALLSCSVQEIEHDRFLAATRLMSNFSHLDCKNVVWVLKGANPLVAYNDLLFVFHGEQPVLAAGGSGDLLSGAIAGLCKQTHSPLDATLTAVSLQIAAAQKKTYAVYKGTLASELSEIFPQLLKR